MLRSITINKNSTYISTYPRSTKYNLRKTFTFSKGLNVILGPNGSGKSTLLKILKAWYGIDGWRYYSTGYWPSTDKNEFKKSMNNEDKGILETVQGTECDRDVQYGVDCDQFYGNVKESLDLENASIFNALGIYDSNSLSSGEQRMEAQNVLTQYLESGSYSRGMGQSFNEKVVDVKPVLFFDEPTLGMAPEIEMKFFDYMLQWAAAGFQIIICTNTPFCFKKDIHYIELKRGWIESQRNMLECALKNAKEIEESLK